MNTCLLPEPLTKGHYWHVDLGESIVSSLLVQTSGYSFGSQVRNSNLASISQEADNGKT